MNLNNNFNYGKNSNLPREKRKIKIIWLAVLTGVVILSALAFWPAEPKDQGGRLVINTATKIDEAKLISQSADDPSLGNPNAKARLIEFANFDCPYSYATFPGLREALQKYAGKIYFVYKDFPLTDVNPNSLPAANAAACAGEQGKFWQMHDKLFINHKNLTDEDFKNYSRQIGLDTVKFNSCYDSSKYLSEIEKDFNEGVELGVTATPTFFLNGYKIQGNVPKEILFQLIEKALAEG